MDSNFIFIDLEWDQRGKRPSKKDPILEIGATKLNDESSFMKYLNNNGVNWRTLRILGKKQKNFDTGISITQAISDLMEYSQETSNVVVWSRDTKDKLRVLSNKYQNTPLIRNVIVLQDLLGTLSGIKDSISFERALMAFSVKYESSLLHIASYDAKCLKNLFLKVVDKYIEINPALKEGVIINNDSDKYHLVDCSYIKKVTGDKSVSIMEVITRKPCIRCCKRLSPLIVNTNCNKEIKRNKKIRSYKNKPVTIKKMYEIAEYFGLNITGGMDEAILSTGYSFWKIYCNKEGYVERVKHENYHSTENRGKNFHSHETFPKDVFSLFEYIKWHDETLITTSIADSLAKMQKKKDKKKKMQKERRRMVRIEKYEDYYEEREINGGTKNED